MCLEVGGQPLPRWRNYQGGRRWRTAASWPRLSSHDNRHLGVRLVRRVEVHEKAQPRTGLAGTPHHKPAARQEVRMLYVGRLHKLRGNLQRLFAGCPSPPSLSSRPASGEPQRLFVRCPSHHVFRRGQTMLGRVRKTVPAQLEATRLARLANVPGEAGGRVNGRARCRESRLRQAATVLGAFGDGMRPAAPCTGSSTEKIAGRRHVSVVPHSPSYPAGDFYQPLLLLVTLARLWGLISLCTVAD